MKNLLFALFVVLSISILTSCQKEEDDYNRLFVNEAPKELNENRFQAYVDYNSLQTAEFIGSFRTRTSDSYVDEYGNSIINYYNVDTDIYKISARKYWNWFQGHQYISNYTEEYEVTSDILNQIRQKLKNKEFVICQKRTISNENDHIGVGLLIWMVND